MYLFNLKLQKFMKIYILYKYILIYIHVQKIKKKHLIISFILIYKEYIYFANGKSYE